jgi:hypothetical protein
MYTSNSTARQNRRKQHAEESSTNAKGSHHEKAQAAVVGLPKVVFSRTVKHVEGKNVHVENRDLVGAVNQLKKMTASTAYPSGIVVSRYVPR